VPGNPTLETVHVQTGKAVVGGLPAKPEIASMKAEELVARARRAVADMSGRWLLLGPDCSINPDTPDTLMAIRP
jgi:uroporphyrinogen decarboxylase